MFLFCINLNPQKLELGNRSAIEWVLDKYIEKNTLTKLLQKTLILRVLLIINPKISILSIAFTE